MKTLINIKTDKEVYFSVAPRMTSYLENFIKEARKDYKAGKNIAGPFATAKEMDRYLDSL
ncbi:MAG: hypothetical protein ABIJ28_03945 [Patescibacteria group bacterium]